MWTGSLLLVGGSFMGALELSRKTDASTVGTPAQDNYVYGSDETIGFDMAFNTAVAELTKIGT